jgi:hypothetical protein
VVNLSTLRRAPSRFWWKNLWRLAMRTWLVCGYALALVVLGLVLSVKLYAPYL